MSTHGHWRRRRRRCRSRSIGVRVAATKAVAGAAAAALEPESHGPYALILRLYSKKGGSEWCTCFMYNGLWA